MRPRQLNASTIFRKLLVMVLARTCLRSLLLCFLVTAGFDIAAGGQERPWYVTPCQLMANPSQFTETLIAVPGLVIVDKGELTMHGYDCADEHGTLLLEFGGQTVDPKDRFRVSRERLETGAVLLKKDADYEQFARLLQQANDSGKPEMLRSTLTGRFFFTPSSAPSNAKRHVRESQAAKARLVISEVDLVNDELEDPVDFSPVQAFSGQNRDTATEVPIPSREDEDKLQRDSLKEEFAYLRDPRKVAARVLANAVSVSAESIEQDLHIMQASGTVMIFAWSSPDIASSYIITVNKPYWLLQTAVSGDAVIWTAKQLVRTQPLQPRSSS